MSRVAGVDATQAVLERVAASDAAVTAAEAERVLAVAEFALAHPPANGEREAAFAVPGSCQERSAQRQPLNADGVPLVAAWAVAELAAALGLSTESGRRLVSEALELAIRLPKLWHKVRGGELAVWRARQIARATNALPDQAAAFVDRHLASVSGVIRRGQVDNLVAEAVARFDNDRLREQAAAQMERRCLDVQVTETTLGGMTPVGGQLDLMDALDLDAAVRFAAQQRSSSGDTAPVTVRRARGLGDIARQYLLLAGQDLVGGAVVGIDRDARAEQPVRILSKPTAHAATNQPVRTNVPKPQARQIMLYLHLSEESVTERHQLGRVGNTQAPVLVETIKRWCAGTSGGDTRVIVRPVLDLAVDKGVDRYEIPDRIAEQAVLRDETCVFPHCGRDARNCDLDHIEPYQANRGDGDRPSQTRPANLAPLCREHHNLKTQRRWAYRRLPDGGYEWRSEVTGRRYRRDSRGTSSLE
ncbi:MAG: HNH endonuclease signature motif containing protein [Beutenbergiaceae bacterium]